MTRSFALAASAAALSLTLVACASAPVPKEQMALAQRSVDTAATNPNVTQSAPAELQQAREKYRRAQDALANKNYDDARRLSEEADADARLAMAKASAVRGERAVSELQASLDQLRQEIDRAKR